MEPRELDALVATKVMGLNIRVVTDPEERAERSHPEDGSPECDEKTGVWWSCPYYSTDITAAWRVVQTMLEGVMDADFGRKLLEMAGAGKCTTYADMVCAVLDTMTPERICLAALKALGVPEGGE